MLHSSSVTRSCGALILVLTYFASFHMSRCELMDTGGYLDKRGYTDEGGDNFAGTNSIHTLGRQSCPCKCMRGDLARTQCRKFSQFCEVSNCNRGGGLHGQRCCQKSVGGFGRCECLSNRFTIAVSFRSELAARVKLADLCAIKKTCPRNCNCSACPMFNVLCISFKAPKGERGWACSADCSRSIETCRRIPWL